MRLRRFARRLADVASGAAAWQGDDVGEMLDRLRGRADAAVLRRFAAACCRTIPEARLNWVFADAGCAEDEWTRLLAVAERHADGTATDAELAAAIALAARVDEAEAWQSDAASGTATAIRVALSLEPAHGWEARFGEPALDAVAQVVDEVRTAGGADRATIADLLRRHFADPTQ